MYISNATGCSSIWGGPAATSPYTVNKDTKKGPAWANSLFEDNAEHGFGMYLGQKYIREQAIEMIEEMAASDKASAEFKAAAAKYLETKNDTKANTPATEALIAELEKAAADGCPTAPEVLAKKDYLAKKSVWIFGGDGWAYDIGYGGLTTYLLQVRMLTLWYSIQKCILTQVDRLLRLLTSVRFASSLQQVRKSERRAFLKSL